MADEREHARIVEIKERYEEELMGRDGVHGVSVGLKEVNGEPTDDWAIRVHLTRKVAADDLEEGQLIPAEIEGVLTDVLEHAQLEPSADTAKYRPLQGGIQIQNGTGLGTLGFFGTSGSTTYGITNHHVASSGSVDQPDNTKGNGIGSVHQAVLSNNLDGTTISLSDGVTTQNTVVDIGTIMGSYNVTAGDLPYAVSKRGRTTGLTSGSVTSISYSGTRTDGWAFTNQMYIVGASPIEQPGDSGSGVVDSSERVVGLLWGGNHTTVAAASPISAVVSQLGVSVPSGTTSVLTSASPIQDALELKPMVRECLGASSAGNRLLAFFDKHDAEIVGLLKEHKGVLVAWRRNHGVELISTLLNCMQHGSAQPPATIHGMPVGTAVANIASALKECGSKKLSADIDQNAVLVAQLLGKSWNEALVELEKMG